MKKDGGMAVAEILEAMMILAFGAAWPASILKSYRSRTAKGKSLFFLLLVEFGYTCGIASKFVTGNKVSFVVVFYFLNLAAVGIDVALYFRNRRLDALADSPEIAD